MPGTMATLTEQTSTRRPVRFCPIVRLGSLVHGWQIDDVICHSANGGRQPRRHGRGSAAALRSDPAFVASLGALALPGSVEIWWLRRCARWRRSGPWGPAGLVLDLSALGERSKAAAHDR